MTCIVGLVNKGDVWLGADSAATDRGLDRTIIGDPKVFIVNNVGFGVCGLPKVMDVVAHAIDIPTQTGGSDRKFLVSELVPALRSGLKAFECTADEDGQSYFEGAMLIGYRGKLYTLQGNFQLINAAAGYDATGSGGDAALGSLRHTGNIRNPKKRLLKALETSAQHNAGVAGPFVLVTVKK